MKESAPDGYYVRKVGNQGLFPELAGRYDSVIGIPADAITQGLKTENNKLSWWFVERADSDSLELIAAAILSGYEKRQLGNIHLLIVPSGILRKKLELEYSPEDARTIIVGQSSTHYNSINMNLGTLAWTAKLICRAKAGCYKDVKITSVKGRNALARLKTCEIDENLASSWLREELLGITQENT